MPRPRRASVIGVGNPILPDDGVGVHVARAVAARRDDLDVVFGVQVAGARTFDLVLSPAVAAAIPRVVERVLAALTVPSTAGAQLARPAHTLERLAHPRTRSIEDFRGVVRAMPVFARDAEQHAAAYAQVGWNVAAAPPGQFDWRNVDGAD